MHRWLALFLFASAGARAAEPDPRMLDALRPFHGVVGTWKGTGTSQSSAGWEETLECNWGFRDKDGRVALEWHIANGKTLSDALITYDPEKKQYRFVARTPSGQTLRFAGSPIDRQTLRLLRSDEQASDSLDRVDIKLVRSGDKLVYGFARRLGKTTFEPVAQVDLFREGEPFSNFLDRPRCVVTGGAGRITIDFQGRPVPLACAGAKKEFLAHPERYLSRLRNPPESKEQRK